MLAAKAIKTKFKVEVLRFTSQSQHNLHQHVVTTMPNMNANKEIEMTYRLEVCSAFLMEGISFVKLAEKQTGSLRDLLERDRISLSQRKVTNCIPTLYD